MEADVQYALDEPRQRSPSTGLLSQHGPRRGDDQCEQERSDVSDEMVVVGVAGVCDPAPPERESSKNDRGANAAWSAAGSINKAIRPSATRSVPARRVPFSSADSKVFIDVQTINRNHTGHTG